MDVEKRLGGLGFRCARSTAPRFTDEAKD
jgi:hypothetical protein